MEPELLKLYESLLPKHRNVVDIVLMILVEKQREIDELTRQIKEMMDRLSPKKEGDR